MPETKALAGAVWLPRLHGRGNGVAVARERVLVSWSGGKDSCMALHALLVAGEYDVAGLLTTVRQEDGRVGMHGVFRELIERQAVALGLPVTIVEVPADASNVLYEQIVATALAPIQAVGVQTIAFGDLFLADIRVYREQLMKRLGLSPIFPVWALNTRSFIEAFIGLGFQAIVVAVDPDCLAPTFAGRLIDERFVADLPPDVDPCGENGEFHSFVFGGPGFRIPVVYKVGGTHFADGHCYHSVRPA